MGWVIFFVVVGLAVILLRGFDSVAGRGPKQVSDGINRSKPAKDAASKGEDRVPCPYCAEAILPAAKKCPHCRSDLGRSD